MISEELCCACEELYFYSNQFFGVHLFSNIFSHKVIFSTYNVLVRIIICNLQIQCIEKKQKKANAMNFIEFKNQLFESAGRHFCYKFISKQLYCRCKKNVGGVETSKQISAHCIHLCKVYSDACTQSKIGRASEGKNRCCTMSGHDSVNLCEKCNSITKLCLSYHTRKSQNGREGEREKNVDFS